VFAPTADLSWIRPLDGQFIIMEVSREERASPARGWLAGWQHHWEICISFVSRSIA